MHAAHEQHAEGRDKGRQDKGDQRQGQPGRSPPLPRLCICNRLGSYLINHLLVNPLVVLSIGLQRPAVEQGPADADLIAFQYRSVAHEVGNLDDEARVAAQL